MCGITGIYNLNGEYISQDLISRMSKIITHRGPDDEGYLFMNTSDDSYQILGGEDTPKDCYSTKYYRYLPGKSIKNYDLNEHHNLAFGHRRLSIIDLSHAGHQPMCNADGSVWITYNGEIYNYIELMSDLTERGHNFKSKTDTEVIIHAYEEYGEKCIEHFNGMFAFAIWDCSKEKLFCARDRFGIKPFYYFFNGDRFLFASEIKALLEDDSIKRIPNDKIIYDYLNFRGLNHTDETFFEGIKQILPAHYMTIKDKRIQINRYWDIDPCNFENVDSKSSDKSDETYAKRFYEIFEDSVRLRLRSDVSVGSCLSGGLDSSSIVCMVDELLTKEKNNGTKNKEKFNTFSSCFENKKYDEREYIQYVLDKTNVEPNFTFPSGEELFDLIENVIWHQDEPFGGASIFAQWHVMKLAKRKGVKVLLDGQGGDEILAGYHEFYISFFADLVKTFQFKKAFDEVDYYSKYHSYPKSRAIVMTIFCLVPQSFKNKVKHMHHRIKGKETNSKFVRANNENEITIQKYNGYLQNHTYRLLTTGLQAALHYEDRNSMAFSIEARVPLLDHRLVEFIFSLPNNQKIDNGMTKIVLRNAMKGMLPEEVRTRMDKMGFETPQDVWFRTVAKDKVLEIFNSDSFKNRKYFEVDRIKEEFDAHCKGEKNISHAIWQWINLELWLRMFIDKET